MKTWFMTVVLFSLMATGFLAAAPRATTKVKRSQVKIGNVIRCEDCGGLGGFRFAKCPDCDGEGGYDEYGFDYEARPPKWQDCDRCDGKGIVLQPHKWVQKK